MHAHDLLDPSQITPPHEVHDEAKVEALRASMAANGWVGAPLLVTEYTGRAWCGTHRRAAAELAGVAVPVIYSVDHPDADPDMYRDDEDRLAALQELGDVEGAEILRMEIIK